VILGPGCFLSARACALIAPALLAAQAAARRDCRTLDPECEAAVTEIVDLAARWNDRVRANEVARSAPQPEPEAEPIKRCKVCGKAANPLRRGRCDACRKRAERAAGGTCGTNVAGDGGTAGQSTASNANPSEVE
jgi:hypothetical protein